MAQPQRYPHTSHVGEFKTWLQHNQIYSVKDPEVEKRESFVPITDVKEYLAENDFKRLDDILLELFEDPDELPNHRTLLDNYAAVFSNLVELDKGHHILYFTKNEFHDHRPLDSRQEPPGFPQDDSTLFKRFCASQWRFCAPNFEKNMNKKFEVDRILPIVAKERINSGGSAILYKIRLHSSYNQLLPQSLTPNEREDSNQNTFALKTYYTSDAADYYHNEVRAFRRLSRYQDANLIGFYGSYEQGDTYNVIFEFADKGTLEDYFKEIANPREPQDIVKFWTGLCGLLKALHSIHNVPERSTTCNHGALHGWHQDVKPANILVVSKGINSPYEWKFKLADLGISHFQKSIGGRVAAAEDNFGTQTYGAPECFRSDDFWDNTDIFVGQKVDIWSLGGVFSEAAIWMWNGFNPGVTSYRQERAHRTSWISPRLGDCFHDMDQPLEIVIEKHTRVSQTLQKGFDYITPGILDIVDNHMLQAHYLDRLEARQLCNKLDKVLHRTPDGARFAKAGIEGSLQSMSIDSSPSESQQLPNNQPSRYWNEQHSPPRSTARFSSQSESSPQPYSSVFPGPRTATPDRSSPLMRNSGVRVFTKEYPRRPFSQPESSMARPHIKTFSISENPISDSSADTGIDDDFYKPSQHTTRSETQYQHGKGPLKLVNQVVEHDHGEPTRPRYNLQHEVKIDSAQIRRNTQPGPSHSFISDPPEAQCTGWSGPYDPQNKGHDSSSAAFQSFQAQSLTATDHLSQLQPINRAPNSMPLPNSETPHAQQPSISKRVPYLSLGEALAWKQEKKEYEKRKKFLPGSKQRRPELPDQWLLTGLQARDHVFIVDDSISMRRHWRDLSQLFGILAYIVKKADDDGIDLYFAMSDTRYNHKDTSKLVKTIEDRKQKMEGPTNLNVRLEDILGKYNNSLRNQLVLRDRQSPDAPQRDLRPLSVYVFTNGDWNGDSDPKHSIASVVNSLVGLQAPAHQVGIQFISFGTDKDCLKRLDHYDSGLNLERDIVDHTHASGNLWKMLLGAIDRYFDDDSQSPAHEAIDGI